MTVLERLSGLHVAGLANQFDRLGLVPPILGRELKPIGAPVKSEVLRGASRLEAARRHSAA